MTRYARPKTLDEALALLDEGAWRVVAGATDFYPALGSKPLQEDILDINGLAELRGLRENPGHIVIGARTSWTDIHDTELPPAFAALQQAAREIGAIQIQNVATVAGNLCNASPAADGVPPLMTLDAEVELQSSSGSRALPLHAFILGNRRTARLPNELVTAVRIPKAATAGRSAFVKLGARRYLVISIAMAAARLALDGNGRIAQAAIAVGACSAVAQRLRKLEAALVDQPAGAVTEIAASISFDELAPIDDVRGSAGYRREAAREIVIRALLAATAETNRRAAA
ncbi:FAD binding domain-containing protein [Aminobacter sp. MET-1]|uniref:FAD binding domain-containing protein n=1 Tax=Aminobacter sp. MET-1 TaxID=2951085 RepID=UPI00226A17B3|nr:xanthine dehydrogenase family protein subunit M [Aminobacter sp. MET-1]MCX8572332.1 xanthine dehydrogenase family protein subunit M [Aminobacter sp. MET-1]